MTVTFSDLGKWKELTRTAKYKSQTVGFVPTMGALHEGHASLFHRSVSENNITVASIFVNPTQFNNPNDLEKYPSTLTSDLEMLTDIGVDYVLLPMAEDMYKDDYNYKLTESKISHLLCGRFRPGHFEGVMTVVLKLLNLVRPTHAYFGEKDYQQYLLVKGMVEALFLDVDIVACPTVRTDAGLALSSRNMRLNEGEKLKAQIFADELKSSRSCEDVAMFLKDKGFKVDYIEEHFGRRFGAVEVGSVRFIDNVQL